jgi:hypothetical protein
MPEGLPEFVAAIEHFSALTLADRAVELLGKLAEENDVTMEDVLGKWLPEFAETHGWPSEQRKRYFSFELLLSEAFQALVLSRMAIRMEHRPLHDATKVTYAASPDGRAALERGDAAAVIARRVLD